MLDSKFVDLNIKRLKINEHTRLLLLYFHFDYRNPFNCIPSNLPRFFTFTAVDTLKYYNNYENQCYCRKNGY